MYHEGEREAQRRAGTADLAEDMAPNVQAAFTPGIGRFLSERTYAFLAAEDHDGSPWVTLVEAERGLLSCIAERHLEMRPAPRADDPVLRALLSPGRVALLAIDLATRRRLRVNGHSEPNGDDTLHVTPSEVFGNCPKYIARRRVVGWRTILPRSREIASLTDVASAIRAADCMAIATSHPARGLDASHRGGFPGFLRLQEDGALEWDDHTGNGMFQSNGNLLVDPRTALAIPLFDSGDLLLLTGRATIAWGPARVTTFTPSAGRLIAGAIRQTFSPPEPSPFSPK